MKTDAHAGTTILAASLLLGISADALLRTPSPGVNFSSWLLLLTGTFLVLARKSGRPLERGWTIVAPLGALCALGIAWRDADFLSFWNTAGALGACGLIAARTSRRSLRETTFYELVHGMLVHCVHAVAGAGFLIAREARRKDGEERKGRSVIPSLLRGVAFAVPFLLLFGALFTSADASFEHVIGSLFDFDLSSVILHILVTGSIAWIAAGFLRGGTIAEEVPAPKTLRESFISLGIIEVGIFLGLVDALFLLFVILQVPYLFGGAAALAAAPSLTLAAYARRGFFELTAAASFSIVTLLLADWLLRKQSRRDETVFRALAGANLLLLGFIMASAWQRLILYQEAFGLTEARLYAGAALTEAGLVSALFAFTVLAGRRDRFAFGTAVSAYAVLLALDIINPDAVIARINIAMGSEGRPFDAAYVSRLSADATPVILSGMETLPAGERGLLARALLRRSDRTEVSDWRSWNMSRAAASASLRNNTDRLVTLSGSVSPTQQENGTCTPPSGSR